MAAAVGQNKMHISLPKISVTHSAKLKAKDVNTLAVSSQPARKSTSAKDGSVIALPQAQLSVSSPRRAKTGLTASKSGSQSMSYANPNMMRPELKTAWLKANDIQNPFNYTVEELSSIVQDRITTGFHGFRHLFKSNTANGNGILSREAFHKVLISSCGYISRDLYDRYLKNIGLQHAQYISYDMFIARFPDNEAVKKEWLMPIQKAKISAEVPKANKVEKHLRNPNIVMRSDIAPATFFLVFLREMVKKRKFRPELHMPEGVREGREHLLKPQLRRLITTLSGYDISDDELLKLYNRFNIRGGGISKADFYNQIGYKDYMGKYPPAVEDDTKESVIQAMAEAGGYDISNMETQRTAGAKSDRNVAEDGKEGAKSRLILAPEKRTKFDSIVDEVIYKLELPTINLTTAFSQFDIANDNFIAKGDFRKVLREFGIQIGALDFEDFLSRNHMRVLNDLIEYKEFVHRFTNREDSGICNRVVNNNQHVFNTEPSRRLRREGSGTDGWNTEELEAGLVEFLSGAYIKLITSLRTMDKKDTKFLPEDKVKPLLERIVNRPIIDSEWNFLLSSIGTTKEGDVPYENVIAVINHRRPVWNITDKLGHKVKVIPRPVTTIEIDNLREEFKRDKEETMHTHFSPYDHLRPIGEITISIKELLRTRYRVMDYAYRNSDRKMTGRLDKDQLRKILKECGLELDVKEMEKLWSGFAVAPDGLYTWSKFCQRYSSDDSKLKQAGEAEDLRLERSMTSAEGFNAAYAQRPLMTRQSITRTSTRSKVSDPVLTRIQSVINYNYEALESLFQGLDPKNRGFVKTGEAVESFRALKIHINGSDMEHICQLFDLENSFRFHYNAFMSALKYKPRLPSQPAQPISKPSSRMLNNRIVRELKGRAPELRRQFKKSDPLGQGFLSLRDFRHCLGLLGVIVAEDDSFSEVTSLFDHALKGTINYEEFTNLCR